MTTFTEHRFYSSELDADAVRVSMADDRGAEYFVVVEAGGRGYRDRRNTAIGTIQRAIEYGWPPGPVAVIPAH